MRKSKAGGALFSRKDFLQALLVCFILVAVLFTPIDITPIAEAAPTGGADQESTSPGLNTWNTTTVTDFQNGTFNDTQAPNGTYLSEVYNAGYKAFWSYVSWEYDQPAGTNITVEVRTGPNSNPDTPTWSNWIEANTSSGSAINAPQWMGYLQYRVTLNTSDTNITPTVHSVSVHYSEDVFYSITGQDDLNQGTTYNLTVRPGGLMELTWGGTRYANNGTYTSRIMNGSDELDQWLEVYWYGSQPAGTNVSIYTRTGNTSTVDASWSGWDIVNSPINSPDYQYIQLMINISTADLLSTPTITSVQVHGSSTLSSDTGGEINVNVALPQITNMLLWETGSATDLMDQRIDVGNEYSLLIRSNYSAGWSDNVQIDIWAWYDNGTELTTYDTSMESGVDRNKSNLQFHFQYLSGTGGAPGTWTQSYPTTGEIEITTYDEEIVDTILPFEEEDRWLRVNFTLGPQVRNASGDGAWFSSADNTDEGLTFNDVYSWNINTTIFDVGTPTAGNSWYDEFGVYKYTSMSAVGNPAGGGAPGSSKTLSPGTNLTYSSNTEYYVNMSLSNLWNEDFTSMISAGNVSVLNMNATSTDNSSMALVPVSLPGHEIPLYVWYNQTGTYLPPMDTGNTTTGDTFQIDGVTWIAWYIDIPTGTPEGRYTSTIKFTIMHE